MRKKILSSQKPNPWSRTLVPTRPRPVFSKSFIFPGRSDFSIFATFRSDQAEAEANLLATGTASEPNNRTVAGSLSVLHKPSGISLTGAAARRKFTSSVRFNDDEVGRPNDSWFYYFKLGWQRNLNRLGKTAFYAEYGSFNQFLGRDADEEAVSALAGIDEDAVCASARSACLVSGSNATIWGLGVVQFVNSAEMQLYTAYRHYEPDVSLSTRRGAGVGSVPHGPFPDNHNRRAHRFLSMRRLPKLNRNFKTA